MRLLVRLPLSTATTLTSLPQMPGSGDISSTSYIWNVNNPNFPEQALNAPSPLCCLEYNMKNHDVLVGGA